MDQDQGVGREVRRLREALGWSQTRLAVEAGMSVSGISMIENGHRNLSTATLAKLAEALGVEVRDLFPLDQAPLPDFKAERRDPTKRWLRAHGAKLLSLSEEELDNVFHALLAAESGKFADRINKEWQDVNMAHDLAEDPNARLVHGAYVHASSRYLQARQLAPFSTSYHPDDPEKPQQVTIFFEKPETPARSGRKGRETE
jgi:transcriptional regulator with XRE-family HTH domain